MGVGVLPLAGMYRLHLKGLYQAHNQSSGLRLPHRQAHWLPHHRLAQVAKAPFQA